MYLVDFSPHSPNLGGAMTAAERAKTSRYSDKSQQEIIDLALIHLE
jgi:hypothetical protein